MLTESSSAMKGASSAKTKYQKELRKPKSLKFYKDRISELEENLEESEDIILSHEAEMHDAIQEKDQKITELQRVLDVFSKERAEAKKRQDMTTDISFAALKLMNCMFEINNSSKSLQFISENEVK